MKTKMTIKKLSAIIVEKSDNDNAQMASTFAAAMMNYGYAMSEELFNTVKTLSRIEIKDLYHEVMPVLQKLKGCDVDYKVMYPNFPDQVMKASRMELFLNAISHYWSLGQWLPKYDEIKRELHLETHKVKTIGLATEEDFLNVFTMIVSSNDSISEEDKSIIEWFMTEDYKLNFPDTIPFKENMCVVASLLLQKGQSIEPLVKTATDVLRILTYLSGGDVSLAENTKFKSVPRKQRRKIVHLLEKVASEEDIYRHRKKWIRAFHCLHVGDYSEKVFALAKKFRNNEKVETYNGRVQYAIETGDLPELLKLLSERGGEFARKLDHVLRVFPKQQVLITEKFLAVADQVATRVLIQVLGHFYTRVDRLDKKIVFPKGNVQCAKTVPVDLAAFSDTLVIKVCEGIEAVLTGRFAQQDDLGKVWIDPELMACPIPTQQRSASEGVFSVARGTKLNLGDESKNTLRFFIYWIGQDIDLSASLHDENFKMIEHISYTHLRSKKYEACHSGDITSARKGASEFIDITKDKALAFGARYVVMNVLVYSGPTFAEHEKCHVGWMLREKPKSNEIYEAATVQQKIDLTAKSRNMIPAVFDLLENKMIYCDLSTSSRQRWGGNNVESNAATIEETLQAIVDSKNKLSLYHLFELHAKGRGQIVDKKEDADQVFSLDEGVTPYDINLISSEYVS